MVEEGSACIDGCQKAGLASDHLSMNKFQSPQDSNYRLVSLEIRRFVDLAPSHINARLNRRCSLIPVLTHKGPANSIIPARKIIQDESREYRQSKV